MPCNDNSRGANVASIVSLTIIAVIQVLSLVLPWVQLEIADENFSPFNNNYGRHIINFYMQKMDIRWYNSSVDISISCPYSSSGKTNYPNLINNYTGTTCPNTSSVYQVFVVVLPVLIVCLCIEVIQISIFVVRCTTNGYNYIIQHKRVVATLQINLLIALVVLTHFSYAWPTTINGDVSRLAYALNSDFGSYYFEVRTCELVAISDSARTGSFYCAWYTGTDHYKFIRNQLGFVCAVLCAVFATLLSVLIACGLTNEKPVVVEPPQTVTTQMQQHTTEESSSDSSQEHDTNKTKTRPKPRKEARDTHKPKNEERDTHHQKAERPKPRREARDTSKPKNEERAKPQKNEARTKPPKETTAKLTASVTESDSSDSSTSTSTQNPTKYSVLVYYGAKGPAHLVVSAANLSQFCTQISEKLHLEEPFHVKAENPTSKLFEPVSSLEEIQHSSSIQLEFI